MKTSRLLFRIHSYFGLITGIFLLLLGLSGSALVFMEELDDWLNRDLLTIQVQAKPLPLDTLYQKITQRYPRLDGLAWINPSAEANEAYNFRLYTTDGKLHTYDLEIITLNPYTAEVLREGRYDQFRSGIMQWLFQFHFSFHLGAPGAALTAIFGLTMLISILTGLIVYRKFFWKALTFRVKIKWKNWRTASSDLHRVIGVWALLFNLIIFFTGFWMNKFAFDSSYWKGETQPSKANIAMPQSFDDMLAKAKKALPEFKPTYVYFPTQEERNFNVIGERPEDWALFGASNAVIVDPQKGSIIAMSTLDKATWSEKLEAVVYPLHVGSFGGLPIRILYVLIGLTPGLLSITGFLLWWRRRGKKRPKYVKLNVQV